jgi:hypothetical protein
VRHEDVGDVAVVRDEIALRDSFVGPERLVEVGEAELPPSAPNRGRHRVALAPHFGGRLVLAEAEIRGRTQPALVRPLGELDLGHQVRVDPGDVRLADAGHLRELGKRGVAPSQRLEELA